MTTYGITFPNKLRGTIALPASKSISARALIIGALAGNITAKGLSDCDDTRVLHKALTQPADEIDIMAAGTAMRFSTAYFAATSSPARIITGTARMRQRPISLLVEALRNLGADISRRVSAAVRERATARRRHAQPARHGEFTVHFGTAHGGSPHAPGPPPAPRRRNSLTALH